MDERTLTRPTPALAPARSEGADPHAPPDVHDVRPLPGRAVAALVVAGTALLCGLFVLGWLPHVRRLRAAADTAARLVDTKPVVDLVSPRTATHTIELTLPGDVRADRATSVYARTGGYLKELPAGIDIGARVKAGQTIAEISAPELDADLLRAHAAVEQAGAAVQHAQDDLAFQKASYKRYEGFAADGGLTAQQLAERRQQLDSATSALRSAEANASAAAAAQQRLEELTAFERVTAPFDGVLTYRGYDVGAMISTAEITAGKELFRIVAADVVRVHVAVPQAYAASVQLGQRADLVLRERPAHPYEGKVARTAQAIESATRTMQIEVDVANADGSILPGTYGQIRLRIAREHPGWLLPTSALLLGAEGTRIAALVDGRVRLRPITIDRDYGTEVEVTIGLDGSEQVVNNPGERMTDGLEVTVRPSPPSTKPQEQSR